MIVCFRFFPRDRYHSNQQLYSIIIKLVTNNWLDNLISNIQLIRALLIISMELSLYIKIGHFKQYNRQNMSKLEGIYRKVISLCQFINTGRNQLKITQLAEKCRTLGLPVSPQYSKERYIYNLALAAITTIIDFSQGFQLATILLRKICPDTGYWDLLHFLYDLRSDVIEILKSSDEVMEKLPIKGIFYGHDLNRIYQCHCTLLRSNYDLEHQRDIQSIKSLKRMNQAKQVIELDSIQKMDQCIIDEKEVDKKQENSSICLSSDSSCIDVDAILLGQISSDDEDNNSCVQKQQMVQDIIDVMVQDLQFEQNRTINIIENQNVSEQFQNKKYQKFDKQLILHSEIQNLRQSRWPTFSQNQNSTLRNFHNFVQTERQNKISRPDIEHSADLKRCEMCLALYHPACQTKQNFICDKCYLRQSSLKYRVIKDIYCGQTTTQFDLTLVQFQCPNAQGAKSKYSETFIVELRIKIFSFDPPVKKGHSCGGKNKKQKNQKMKLNFYLNCQPMKIKNSLQLDRVLAVKIPLKYLEHKNVLIIQNSNKKCNRKSTNQIIKIGVYQVVPRSRKKEILSNSILKLPQKSLKLFYNSVLARQNIPYISISLLSGVSNVRMQSPVRSLDCEHLQCFDYSQAFKSQKVENFVNRKQKSSHSKQSKNTNNTFINWRLGKRKINIDKILYCPICHIEMKSLYLDQLFLNQTQKLIKNRQSLSHYFMKIQNEPTKLFSVDIQKSPPSSIQAQLKNKRYSSQQNNTNMLISQYSYNTKPNIAFSDSQISQTSSIEQIEVMEISKRKIIKKQSKSFKHQTKSNKFKHLNQSEVEIIHSFQQLTDQRFFNRFLDIQEMIIS